MKKTAPLLITLFLIFQEKTIAQISRFNDNDEGWTVVGDAQGAGVKPLHRTSGGHPKGCVAATDAATGGTWYWSAPKSFLGDKSGSYNRFLKFELKQSDIINQFDEADVIIEGANGQKLVFDTPNNPDTTWTAYTVSLNENVWKLNAIDGAKPTQAIMQEVLKNIVNLWIRGEFIEGADTGALDNVIFEGSSFTDEIKEKGYVDLYGLYFTVGTANLTPESQPVIQQIVKTLQENPKLNIVIEGHTSNEGETTMNQKLSQQRAVKVKEELLKNSIVATRLSTIGYGSNKPVANNNNEVNRAKNRRVTIRMKNS